MNFVGDSFGFSSSGFFSVISLLYALYPFRNLLVYLLGSSFSGSTLGSTLGSILSFLYKWPNLPRPPNFTGFSSTFGTTSNSCFSPFSSFFSGSCTVLINLLRPNPYEGVETGVGSGSFFSIISTGFSSSFFCAVKNLLLYPLFGLNTGFSMFSIGFSFSFSSLTSGLFS